MIYSIRDYCFDDERLLFYKKNISDTSKDMISREIPINDNYKSINSLIEEYQNSYNNAYYLPYEGGICFTRDCQLRCNYCSYNSGDENISTLTEENVSVFVNYLIKNILIRKLLYGRKDKLVLYFSGGGEPTLDWKFFELNINNIIAECNKSGIEYEFHLTTNGILTDAKIDFICHNFTTVMISYDGHPMLQDKNRKFASQMPSSKVVEHTISMFEKNNIDYTIRSTVWPSDFQYLYEMATNIYEKFPNCPEWSILPVFISGRAADNVRLVDEYDLDKNDFIQAFIQLNNYVDENYGKHRITTPLHYSTLVDGFYCGAFMDPHPWLLPDNKLYYCLEATSTQSTFGEISNGRVAIYSHGDESFPETCYKQINKCRNNCIAYRFCKGGCPARILREKNEKMNSVNWECEMIRRSVGVILNAIIDYIENGVNSSIISYFSISHLELVDNQNGYPDKVNLYTITNKLQ